MEETGKKSRFAEPDIFQGFEIDLDFLKHLDFQKSGCRLKDRLDGQNFPSLYWRTKVRLCES